MKKLFYLLAVFFLLGAVGMNTNCVSNDESVATDEVTITAENCSVIAMVDDTTVSWLPSDVRDRIKKIIIDTSHLAVANMDWMCCTQCHAMPLNWFEPCPGLKKEPQKLASVVNAPVSQKITTRALANVDGFFACTACHGMPESWLDGCPNGKKPIENLASVVESGQEVAQAGDLFMCTQCHGMPLNWLDGCPDWNKPDQSLTSVIKNQSKNTNS